MAGDATPKDIITPEAAGTLSGLFRERVARSPEAVAYRDFDQARGDWQAYTWREMAGAVARWQTALQREGLEAGERVALMVRNSPEWVMLDQAALGLGLVVVPLYIEDRAENVAYILNNAGARLLLIGGDAQWETLETVRDQLDRLVRIVSVNPLKQAEDAPANLCSLTDWLEGIETAEPEFRDVDPHALATIVYTSGTTGKPKGVMLSQHNILWNAHASQSMVDVYPDDEFLSFLPLSHTFERTIGYYLCMMCGARTSYNRSIPELSEDLLQVRPTILISVPRIFERVYNRIQEQLAARSPLARKLFLAAVAVGWRRFEYRQGRAGWSPLLLTWPLLDRLVGRKVRQKLGGRLRFAVCGGAALAPDIARFFIGLGLDIVQGYGLTETSPVLCANSLRDNIPASVGRAIPDVELRISDQEELLGRGPGVMLGYWDNPEATDDMIDADGWLHTGDKASMDSSGHVYITGRIKEVIVLANGEKVPPADMEMAISMDPLFEQVMILGDNRPYLTALVVLNHDQARQELERLGLDPEQADAINGESFKSHILDRIRELTADFPGYARVHNVHSYWQPWTVEDGLITPTMKVRREKVAEQFQDDVREMYSGH